MKKEKTRGRIVLVDGSASVIRFLKMNLENAGYDVSSVSNVEEASALPLEPGICLAALPLTTLEETRDAVTRLRRSLSCPILVYGSGGCSEKEMHALGADGYIDRFYEPADFIKAVEAVISGKPRSEP